MPKWLSCFDIGNSKMVLLYLQAKFKCSAHFTISQPNAFPTVRPHCLAFAAALLLGSEKTKFPMPFTRLCPASLPSWCSFWVECSSFFLSPSTSYLALRLVLGAVSSKPKAGGPYFSTLDISLSSTLPEGFQHDRDIVLLIIDFCIHTT